MAILPAFFGQAPAQGDPAAGGILGGFGQGMQSLTDTIANNRQQMLGFGMGLMGGNSVADGWQQASAGLARGALLDASTKKEKDAQAERERRRNGLLKLAEKYGLDPAIADNPDIAGTALAQRMTPDNGTRVTKNGRDYLVFRDGRVQEIAGLPQEREAGNLVERNGETFRVTSDGVSPVTGLPAKRSEDDLLLERAGATPEEKTAYARAKAGLGGTAPKIEWVEDGSGGKRPYIIRPGAVGQDPSIKPAAVEGGMPAPGVKLTDSQRTSLGKIKTASLNLNDELTRFDQLVKKHGSTIMPGEARSQVESVRTNIIMQLKNLYELGAITGPDLPLMEKMISDPSSWGGAYGTEERVTAQTKELRRILQRTVANTEAGMTGKAPEPPPGEAPKAGPTLAPGQTRPFARGTLTREN